MENKIPDGTNLIHINLIHIDADKNVPDVNGLLTTTVLNTKIRTVEYKVSCVSGLVSTAVLNAKTVKVENKILMLVAL